jgi:hypothetical protein
MVLGETRLDETRLSKAGRVDIDDRLHVEDDTREPRTEPGETTDDAAAEANCHAEAPAPAPAPAQAQAPAQAEVPTPAVAEVVAEVVAGVRPTLSAAHSETVAIAGVTTIATIVLLGAGRVLPLPALSSTMDSGHRFVVIGMTVGAAVGTAAIAGYRRKVPDVTILSMSAVIAIAATVALVGTATWPRRSTSLPMTPTSTATTPAVAPNDHDRSHGWNDANQTTEPAGRGKRTGSDQATAAGRAGQVAAPADPAPKDDPSTASTTQVYGAGTPILSDALNETSAPWKPEPDASGSCVLDGAGLHVASVAGHPRHECVAAPTITNGTVEISFLFATAQIAGLLVRRADNGGTYSVAVTRAGQVSLTAPSTAGGATTAPVGSAPGFKVDGSHVIAVTAAGQTLTIYLDHAKIGSAPVTGFPGGRIGVFVDSDAAGQAAGQAAAAAAAAESDFHDLRTWAAA